MPEGRTATKIQMSEISKNSMVLGMLRYFLQNRYVADLVPLPLKMRNKNEWATSGFGVNTNTPFVEAV